MYCLVMLTLPLLRKYAFLVSTVRKIQNRCIPFLLIFRIWLIYMYLMLTSKYINNK